MTSKTRQVGRWNLYRQGESANRRLQVWGASEWGDIWPPRCGEYMHCKTFSCHILLLTLREQRRRRRQKPSAPNMPCAALVSLDLHIGKNCQPTRIASVIMFHKNFIFPAFLRMNKAFHGVVLHICMRTVLHCSHIGPHGSPTEFLGPYLIPIVFKVTIFSYFRL